MNEIELLDIADDLLVINKTTIERLFQEENTDVLVLYLFYYKTAKWQKHNPIKANDDYCKKCLHWGLDKLKKVKKRLKEIELISIEKRINEKNQITGWYVRVNYIIDKVDISSGIISTSRVSPLVEKSDHKILLNNNINTINNISTITTTTMDNENLYDYLQENGFVLAPIHYEVISNWEDNELTRYAIKQAVLNNKYNIKYIDKILYSYKKDNITTIQQVIEREEEHQNKMDLYYQNKYKIKESKYEKTQRKIEEWLNE